MSKKIQILLIILVFTVSMAAQTTITGTVFNQEDEPLLNATVILLSPSDSIMKYFGVTNKSGEYQIKQIMDGKYIMQVSFVGTKTIYNNITLPSESGNNLGKTIMNWESQSLGEVTIVDEYIPIRFRSDTVEFNANAFVIKSDAVVDDLLKKIPGIEVDVSGNIKALGENVEKILVDGKEFFGSDKKVTTKNLPAASVEKVEVFDKKSYEAEFMGIDDGERDRTINLELKEDAKAGIFGNFEVAGGPSLGDAETDARYKIDGKLYSFNGNSQMAVLGMANNINQFGFAAQGMGKFGSQIKGYNKSAAAGLNLSYYPEEFKKYYISYLGSGTDRLLKEDTEAEYYSETGSYNQTINMDQEYSSRPNAIDFGIHHRFNSKHNLIITGNGNLNSNSLNQVTNTHTFAELVDLNRLTGINNNIADVLTGSFKGSYMARFNEGNTQFKISFSGSIIDNSNQTDLENTTFLYNPDSTIYANQFIDNYTDNSTLSFSPQFVQRIGSTWFMITNLQTGINTQLTEQTQGNMLPVETKIDSLSPDFQRQNIYFRPGLTLRRSTLTSQFALTLDASWNNYETSLWDVNKVYGTIFNVLPGLQYEKRFRTGRRLNIMYRTSVAIPSAGQLMPVFSTANPLALSTGNENLEPSYSHNAYVEYRLFDQFSFTSVFTRFGGTYTNNNISWQQTITEDYIKINSPVNTDWDYTAFGHFNFSTPWRRAGIKLNLVFNESWHKGINIINSEENILNSLTHSVNFSIENHRKQWLDARIGASIAYTDAQYSIQEGLDNKYFNVVYYSSLYLMPSDRWNLNITGNLTQYSSQTLDEEVIIPSIDAALSLYFLKGNRGVLNLRVADLLNRNTGFQQISDINYLMQINSNSLGRYVLLSFKYRLTGGQVAGRGKR